MDSLKTNTKIYVEMFSRYSVAQIVAIAESEGFRVYVAWELERAAQKGIFGFAKSRDCYRIVTSEAIKETADYGWDIGGSGEEKKIFANLFD